MDCTDFIDRYSEYDDSLLSPADMEAFRRHLAVCASCGRYDRVLRKGRMIARQVPGPAPSEEFLPSLQRRLWMDAVQPHRSGSRMAGGVLTLALTAMLAIWVMGPPTDVTGSPDQLHVHRDAATHHGAVLPAAALATRPDPRDWTVPRVDHSRASSYSPLVTGPPAYRADRVTFTSPSSPMQSTLD